ncbi:MAG: polysaccharide biosynthesis C-terminal domain-containing protein [Spirochaetota bacterium]|nr:polysaccharide biosynthesis C-terminal domain-containing protein [Thermodesulfobacteriota bacterium]MDY6970179.1 polysaccharide biosynthesis C-terminal domain-containing protein [Spirochaetota bacterium]
MNNQTKNSGQAQQVILGSANVLGGIIGSSILGVFRSLIIAGGLGPSLYGIWNILMVIFSYNSFVHLGLMHGMNKEMPLLIGKGDVVQAEKIKDNTFWSVLIIAIIANIFLIIASFIFQDRFQKGIMIAICILAINNMLFQLYIFLTSLLRTDKAFGVLGLANILLSLMSLACVILFFKFLSNKLYGALFALLLGYLFVGIFIFYQMKYRIKLTLNLHLTINIFKIGLPIIIIQTGYILFTSIDRWMIAGVIDQINIGYYGIGLTIANFLFAGASTVAFTLYPFMIERFGETNDEQQSEQLVYTPIIVLSYLMAVICTLMALIAPLFITYVLPAYIPGINASIILILGIYFISIMTINSNFLISINKQNAMLYLQIAAITLSIVLNYVLIKNGLGIEGVALGTATAYFLYSTGVMLLAFWNFSKSYKDLFLRIGKTYFPFMVCLVIYLFLKSVYGGTNSSFSEDLFATFIQILILFSISILLILHLNKNTGIICILRDMIHARLEAV